MTGSDYHHGDLQKAVIESALRMLEAGESDISMRRIAKEIGVSHQAPYRHFSSKLDVLLAVRAHGFSRLATATRQAAAKHPRSARLQLEAAGFSYVKHATEYPALYQLMFGSRIVPTDVSDEHRASARDAFQALASIIQQGEPPFTKLTLERSKMFWAMGHGIASLSINGFFSDQEAPVDGLAKAAFRAICSEWFPS